MPYTLIDHTADIGMRVCASSLPGLFEEAANALCDILGGRTDIHTDLIPIACEGVDEADLLVRWLQEVLFLVEVRGFRFNGACVDTVSKTRVKGSLEGAFLQTPLETEIKAVTYHNLTIERIDNDFVASIILDT